MTSPPHGPASPPPSILVVEDEETTRHLVRRLLAREGFAVVECSDGDEAVRYVRSHGPPALVLTDMMVPYVDGMGVIREVRGTPGWERVPIVCLTSRSLEHDVVRALDAGATDYVVKPFRPEELMARIRRLLRGGA